MNPLKPNYEFTIKSLNPQNQIMKLEKKNQNELKSPKLKSNSHPQLQNMKLQEINQ